MRHRNKIYTPLAIIIAALVAVIFFKYGNRNSSAELAPDIAEPATWSAEEEVTAPDIDKLPAYSGEAVVTLHDDVPYFSEQEITDESFERYGELDEQGRCTEAYASIGTDLMPAPGEQRESIYEIRPTGWHSVRYDIVDQGSLYNRSHLIAWQLAGENANERNLITGTRYLNDTLMRPLEEDVGDYVRKTGHHVMYRVTPVFNGDDLIASGVIMEAYSVEDGGEGICFCRYLYNIQPGIGIDYATGDSWQD